VVKRREAGVRGTAAAQPDPPRSPQEAVESTLAGKLAISGFIVFLLIALLVSNLPESELKDTGRPLVRPLLEATALSQTWNLFAPNPRQSTLRLEARMTYADGTTSTWRPPDGDPVVSEYRSYRWRKWATNVMSDRRQGQWPQVARWVAEHHRRDGQLPTQVVLVRQFYFAPAPGSGDNEVPPWGDDVLFVARYPEEES
jgi:hypothetical protein